MGESVSIHPYIQYYTKVGIWVPSNLIPKHFEPELFGPTRRSRLQPAPLLRS